jgi:hypothetical protein
MNEADDNDLVSPTLAPMERISTSHLKKGNGITLNHRFAGEIEKQL